MADRRWRRFGQDYQGGPRRGQELAPGAVIPPRATAPPSPTQPNPRPNDGPHIADLVMHDLAIRKAVGIERYGTPLQANNGRDALRDAYEEALDLAQYLRQAIEEREIRRRVLES